MSDALRQGARLHDVLQAVARDIVAAPDASAWAAEQVAASRAGAAALHPSCDGRTLRLAWTRKDGASALSVAEVPLPAADGEQRFRDLAESMADWFWETGPDLTITHVSHGFTILTGIACEALIGRSWWEVLADAGVDDQTVLRHRDILQGRRDFRDLKLRWPMADSRVLSMRISGKALFGPDGMFRGYRSIGTDISRDVARELDARKTQAQLIGAIANLSEDFVLFDENERLIFGNNRMYQAIPSIAKCFSPGTTFTDFAYAIGRMAGNAEDEADLERWVAERTNAFRLGLSFEERGAGGLWFLIRYTRLVDGSTVITRTDITEIKRREYALKESEARFRAIFEHAALGIAVVQQGGSIAHANPALEAMLGYEPGELAAVPYQTTVHPAHRHADGYLAQRLQFGEIDEYSFEKRYLRKDGNVFWGRMTASMVPGEDDEQFTVVMIEDIDHRKRAESELSMFRAIIDAAHEAIVVLCPEGRVYYANSAFTRLFGNGAATLPAVTYHHYYSPEALEVIRGEMAPALRRGESWEGVLEAQDGTGRRFPLWQRTGVVRDAEGRDQFYFGFMHDHTQQTQIETELLNAKDAAEQANVAKTRFLAAASHDLRQPLQALAMFVAVLSTRNRGSEHVALIGRIQDSVTALESLLNSLLDVSKLEAGLVVPMEENFSVEAMIKRLAAEFEPLTGAEDLTLRVVPSKVVVRSDPGLLERILRNLLNNAVRYTNTGSILFGCRRRGRFLRIEVWDTGIGIPASQFGLIFREFHQLGNSARDRRQGLGLGLAIVERLAALLGHHIDVASTPDKGSRFAVEVPMAQLRPSAVAPRQLPLEISVRGACIIVIDDDPDVLESTRLLLESWGHKVLTAPNCDTVLRRLAHLERNPDLILADYRLQNGSTGGQAIARIRVKLNAAIPALILTGDTAPERLRQAKASGHGLLHKPVTPDTLRAAIDEILTRPSVRKIGRAAHH